MSHMIDEIALCFFLFDASEKIVFITLKNLHL